MEAVWIAIFSELHGLAARRIHRHPVPHPTINSVRPQPPETGGCRRTSAWRLILEFANQRGGDWSLRRIGNFEADATGEDDCQWTRRSARAVMQLGGNQRQETEVGPGVRKRSGALLALLEPRRQGLVVDTMKLREAGAAQSTGLIDLDQCGLLFGGVAQPPTAVCFYNRFICSTHIPRHYECYEPTSATPDQRCFGPRLRCVR
jgi:hypothetical protein